MKNRLFLLIFGLLSCFISRLMWKNLTHARVILFIVLELSKTYNLSARKQTSEENAYEENLSAVESEARQQGRIPRQDGRS